MAFIKTIAPADARGAVAEMYARQQSAWGYVPNYAKVFCHRPGVMARWGRLLAEIKRPMDKRRFELVTFAAAHELRNSPCTLAHGKALTAYFPEHTVHGIAEGRFDEAVSATERAVLRFARQVAKDASRITEGEVALLRDHGLSDAEIFDIAAVAAGRAFFTKVLDALGTEPDAGFLELEESFRRPLRIGRPIDIRKPVRMPAREPRQPAS